MGDDKDEKGDSTAPMAGDLMARIPGSMAAPAPISGSLPSPAPIPVSRASQATAQDGSDPPPMESCDPKVTLGDGKGRKSSPQDRERVTGPKEVDQKEGDMVISPSRFSVLATEDPEERDGDGDDDPDDTEEGQVVSEVHGTDSKKDTAKNVKFRPGTSLKLRHECV
ncbi:hypothetical protein F2Q68_00012349 [Brassica cretica]|uniref:Uncharacterized protein n=1 Tax=Brassica cretica TaxID=69181 RepID=A0A8S9KS75_BRACR|nr:hypothetical protein F2Q68_00012349 [Brassica cretica]